MEAVGKAEKYLQETQGEPSSAIAPDRVRALFRMASGIAVPAQSTPKGWWLSITAMCSEVGATNYLSVEYHSPAQIKNCLVVFP